MKVTCDMICLICVTVFGYVDNFGFSIPIYNYCFCCYTNMENVVLSATVLKWLMDFPGL